MIRAAAPHESAEAVRQRATQLVEFVEAGRIREAVREFYAAPPRRRGLLAVAGFGRAFRIQGLGVNGDTSFVECALELQARDGRAVSIDRVAVARWRDGKIVSERILPRPAPYLLD